MTKNKKKDGARGKREAISSNYYEDYDIRRRTINASSLDIADKSSIRNWWHEIMRNYGKYACYGMFLILPSDKETIRYLTEFGKELNFISGDNCLVIVLSKDAFKSPSFNQGLWNEIVGEHSDEGYSIKFAHIFGIDLTEFPCLLLFREIRSAEHVTIPLNGLTVDELTSKMRAIFSAIHRSVESKKNPLVGVIKLQSIEKVRTVTQKVSGRVESLAEKTLEAAINALMGSTIK
jgi:hypothetical protein